MGIQGTSKEGAFLDEDIPQIQIEYGESFTGVDAFLIIVLVSAGFYALYYFNSQKHKKEILRHVHESGRAATVGKLAQKRCAKMNARGKHYTPEEGNVSANGYITQIFRMFYGNNPQNWPK